MTAAPMDKWLETLAKSMQAVGRDMLRFEEFEILGKKQGLTGQMVGAYLPIVSDELSVYVGILSDPAGAQKMARAFLYLGANDPLSNEDLADALGEMSNMLGGVVQRNVESARQSARLGLPIFVQGVVRPGSNVAEAALEVKLGGVVVTLVLIQGPRKAG